MKTAFLTSVAAAALMGSMALAQTDDSTETDPLLTPEAEAEAEGDAMLSTEEGDAESAETETMPAEGEDTDAAETETMPAEGEDTDAAETETMPAEGEDTDAAETDAMPAEGEAETDMATDAEAEGDDAAGQYGAFADTAVSDLIGMNVLSEAGDDVGEIDELVSQAGGDVMAIVGVGGFLGLGEHSVALPLADFTMGEDALMLGDMTKEDLEALPEYADDAEPLPLDVTVSGDPVASEEAPMGTEEGVEGTETDM